MRLVIPTYGRAAKQVTLRSLPPALREVTTLVTSDPAEAAALRRMHKLVVDAPVKTISEKRQWIAERWPRDRIFMLDDDMVFQCRLPDSETAVGTRGLIGVGGKSLLSSANNTDHAIENVFSVFESCGYNHFGLSSRLGNDLVVTPWRVVTRAMHAFGFDARVLARTKAKFTDVAFREDMHVTLNLLRAGHPNLTAYRVAVSPGAYGAAGGCSGERTVAASDIAAHTLAALHPGIVRVVQKTYMGLPRKEVIVQWKKAYTGDPAVLRLLGLPS